MSLVNSLPLHVIHRARRRKLLTQSYPDRIRVKYIPKFINFVPLMYRKTTTAVKIPIKHAIIITTIVIKIMIMINTTTIF